jgi:VWFA-related protein
MRLLSAGIAVFLSSVLAAQQAEPPSFRASTTLIEFTFVAVDKDGRPVRDLEKEEISIEENGHARDVVFFQFEGDATTIPETAVQIVPGLFTNRTDLGSGPSRNVTAILLDALNTPGEDQMAARDQVLKYVQKMAPGTRVAVYRLANGFDVIHDFTDDIGLLPARLEQTPKSLPVFVSADIKDLDCLGGGVCAGAVELDQFDIVQYQLKAKRRRQETLAALELLGNHLEGIPGRKSLVWIGGGLSMFSMTGCSAFGSTGGFESYEVQVRQTAQKLASQGIVLYPVDSKGTQRERIPPPPVPPGVMDANLNAPPDPSAGGFRPVQRPGGAGRPPIPGDPCDSAFSQSALRVTALSNYHPESTNALLADTTGGRVIMMTNDLAAGIKAAADDERGSYSVGFYAADASDRQWRRVDVKVNRAGVKVLHRKGYAPQPVGQKPADWTERQWQAAVASPVGSAAIHLSARAERDGKGELAIEMEIATKDLHLRRDGTKLVAEFELVVAEKSTSQATMRRQTADFTVSEGGDETEPIHHTWKMTPRRETQKIRLLVRDRFTGRYGSLDIDLRTIR